MSQTGLQTVSVILKTVFAFCLSIFSIFLTFSIASAAELVRAQVGQPIILRIDGKPAKDHIWSVSETESHGLNNVEIKRLGWTMPNGTWFGTGTLRYVVKPTTPGQSQITISFAKKFGNQRPIRKKTFRFIVDPVSADLNTGSTTKLPWRK